MAHGNLPVLTMLDRLTAGGLPGDVYFQPAHKYGVPNYVCVDLPRDVGTAVRYSWYSATGEDLGGGEVWANPGHNDIPILPPYPGGPPCDTVICIALEHPVDGVRPVLH